MARTKTTDKATVKNGRASRATGEAYNANHNTLEATRLKQGHIDNTRTKLNMYIKFCDGHMEVVRGGNGGFDSRSHELEMYDHFYSDGLDARNERYIAERHPERCQTMQDLYSNPKTAPLETIFQVGSKKSVIDKDTRREALTRAWQDTMKEFMGLYKGHFVPVDMALHRDEAEDHIHSRVMLMARDKFGHLVPNQTAALEAMGFERPNPEQPKSRTNNALVTFTDTLRETFYRHCEQQGIKIDRNVENHSKRQVEILEYKCEQFRKDMELSRAEAEKARLEAQAASKALSKTLGNIETLNERIIDLERSQAALEERNISLISENKDLKTENNELRSQNIKLETQKGTLEEQLTNLRQQMEKAQKEKAAAEQAKAIALDKLQKLEAHEAELFRRYQSRKVKIYGTLPPQKEKRSFGGKVTQEALPERVIVDKADFERQTQQAEYHVMVDYNRDTMKKLDEKMSVDENVQDLKDQVEQQRLEINRWKKTADNLYMELEQRKGFMYRHGLEPAYNNEQQQIHSQSQNHTHHRR